MELLASNCGHRAPRTRPGGPPRGTIKGRDEVRDDARRQHRRGGHLRHDVRRALALHPVLPRSGRLAPVRRARARPRRVGGRVVVDRGARNGGRYAGRGRRVSNEPLCCVRLGARPQDPARHRRLLQSSTNREDEPPTERSQIPEVAIDVRRVDPADELPVAARGAQEESRHVGREQTNRLPRSSEKRCLR